MSGHKNNTKSNTEVLAILDKVFASVSLPSSARTKEEAWVMLLQKIEKKETQAIVKTKTRVLWASLAAASLLLLLGFTYLKFSTVTYTTSRGQQLSINLPDGSKSQINACSQIKFSRYWLINPRRVELSGEAFFIVERGNTFTVIAPMGHRVEVIGTQFNVKARTHDFKITCFEGKVRVVTKVGKATIVSHGYSAKLEGDSIVVHKLITTISEKPAWTKGEFYFESTSLMEVFDELMRQYDVSIHVQGFNPEERYYTGYFTNKNLTQALDWITLPMNLKYTYLNDTSVLIFPLP